MHLIIIVSIIILLYQQFVTAACYHLSSIVI